MDPALVSYRLDQMETKLKNVEQNTQALVDAWKAAGQLVSFVKWAASIVTALVIVWTAITKLQSTHQ